MHAASLRSRRDLHHALAATLVSHPRCTLSELARGAGISRATLYRFAPTREAIDEALFAAGFERLEAAAIAFEGSGDARQVLEQFTVALLADWELVTLLFARMMEEQQRHGDLHLLPARWAPLGERFEAFFLRGQTAGIFNVGFSAVWLADFYWTCFYGITWSLARGRLAPAAAASTLLASFQHGAMKP
ncbi:MULTISPECIES: TetR/AcrR family transcriptional regulator [unclassified Stenotrophomonas]|uniref:TetR/AcrR family transcriptional regulator n=1 Tax=unclassified Stenotrophomonas TaxID=196198 RepID=UPI000D15D93D|nr:MULTISPECIES: TetR/AcrR family transcriptional regulator [unclassified Stenotrophomonas]PTA70893.1 transcriptional regulator [Stenotrophomonas sp. Nf1]PTA82066.1 transcriptional regulator [Stenotrophomonas sp. Nf4]